MKGLLHSKRFRKNLKKWLCMYVGTLLILTTVITYSKYISSLGLKDEARITKFDVKLDKIGENLNCSGNTTEENVTCTTSNYRPTQEITYEFSINPEFEVNTNLYTFIYVLDNFDIIELKDMTSNEVIYPKASDEESPSLGSITETVNGESVTKQLLKTKTSICVNEKNTIKTYRITVKYKDYKFTDTAQPQNLEIVKIGYSAQQSKEGDSLCIAE